MVRKLVLLKGRAKIKKGEVVSMMTQMIGKLLILTSLLLILGVGCSSVPKGAQVFGTYEAPKFTKKAPPKSPVVKKKAKMKEGRISPSKELCDNRPRKIPKDPGKKYARIGTRPVAPERSYDPRGSEQLIYLSEDVFLKMQYLREGKIQTASSWVEEGTVVVADKNPTTVNGKIAYRIDRICRCGNKVLGDRYIFTQDDTLKQEEGEK